MSDARAKAERSRAKDARQSPAPDRPVSKHRNKKKKPFPLYAKFKRKRFYENLPPSFYKVFVFGRYRTIDESIEVMKQQKRRPNNPYLFSLDGVNFK